MNAARNGAVSAVHVSGGRGWLYLTFIVAVVCCGVEVRMPSGVLQKEDCSLHGIVEAGSMFVYTVGLGEHHWKCNAILAAYTSPAAQASGTQSLQLL